MKHIMGPESKSSLTAVVKSDIQPNACDVRLERVFRILHNLFVLDDDKQHRGSEEIFPDADGYFNLTSGSYEIVMGNIIKVGEHEAGWVVTRSTLIRNGLFLTSGLYDSGYHGKMGGALHITAGPARIKKGSRIGQYLSFDAEMLHEYDGSYGLDADGNPKEDEQRYN